MNYATYILWHDIYSWVQTLHGEALLAGNVLELGIWTIITKPNVTSGCYGVTLESWFKIILYLHCLCTLGKTRMSALDIYYVLSLVALTILNMANSVEWWVLNSGVVPSVTIIYNTWHVLGKVDTAWLLFLLSLTESNESLQWRAFFLLSCYDYCGIITSCLYAFYSFYLYWVFFAWFLNNICCQVAFIGGYGVLILWRATS